MTIFSWVPIARQPTEVSLVSNTEWYRTYPIPIKNSPQFTFWKNQNILQVKIWVRQNKLRFLCVISKREPVDEESQKFVYFVTELIRPGVAVGPACREGTLSNP